MARMGHDSERAALIYLHSSAERQRALADEVGKAAAAELAKSKLPKHLAREWHEPTIWTLILPSAGPLTWAPRPRLERGTYRLGGGDAISRCYRSEIPASTRS